MIGNQPIYIKKWDQQGIKNINDLIHENGEFLSQDEFEHTRGIWKVLSMVFYLSNQFTNPIMFGIILKSYLSSLL